MQTQPRTSGILTGHRPRLAVLMAVLLLGAQLVGPWTPITSASEDATTYVLGDHVAALDGWDDLASGPIAIGFDFPFYGLTHDGFYVTTNGVVSFGGASNTWTNTNLPAITYNHAAVFPFWDDLHPRPGPVNPDIDGYILHALIAAEAHGNPYGVPVRIVQWTNYGFYNDAAVMGTFQVHLIEDGRIVANYVQLASDRARGSSATIGLQASGQELASATVYTVDSADAVQGGQALLFAPDGGDYTITGPSFGQFWDVLLYKGAPPPDTPTNPSPADRGEGSQAPMLTWNGGANTDDFSVRLSLNESLNPAIIVTATTDTSLAVASSMDGYLTGAETYYWQVVARGPGGNRFSEIWSFTVEMIDPPEAPTISVSAGDQQLTVAITQVGEVTTYDYSLDGGATWQPRNPASADSPLVLDGLVNGTAYDVVLRPVLSGVPGSPSNTVTASPQAPALPPPPASPDPDPEPVRGDDGRVPSDGDAAGTVDGEPVMLEVERTPTGGVSVQGDGFGIVVTPNIPVGSDDSDPPSGDDQGGDAPGSGDGSPDEDAEVVFTRGRAAEVRVQGFAPRSPVSVYLFSDPRLLGTFTTDAAGALVAATDALPDDVSACPHTLHVEGRLSGGRQVAVSLGVWVEADRLRFADTVGSPAARAVQCLNDLAVVEGYADGSFGANRLVTRQAFAAFVHRMQGAPQPQRLDWFEDVGPDHPFVVPIAWLAESGLANGYDDGLFHPNRAMTRQAAAAFVYRIAGEPHAPVGAPFEDVDRTHPFAREIGWLADQGITRGYADGSFRPTEDLRRGPAARLLVRSLDWFAIEP